MSKNIKINKEDSKTLYEESLNVLPQFKTNKEALEFYEKEYYQLTNQHGVSGDELWMEAETTNRITFDHSRILTIARNIQMLKYLINKYE